MFFLLAFVTCELIGGQLGNQMHEIATTLAYGWDHGYHPLFPCLHRGDANIPANRERVFFRLDTSPLPNACSYVFEHYSNFTYKPIPDHADLDLKGLFQCYEYYHHHRERLKDIFAPSAEEYEKLKGRYAHLINHPNTVAIHVRTFNKEWHDLIPFVGMDYYIRAMNQFPPDSLFVIFSDRINWCKHHFSRFNANMVFIEGQDHIEDFFLMSMMKHHIIANSSFSWWAAYLCRNPGQRVVAPSHFLRPKPYLEPVYRSTPPGWKILNIELNIKKNPYPVDMKAYDRISQSLDTQ